MGSGERLRAARLSKGLTQADLAAAAGVHHAQIGRYENKGAVPAADVLSRLADALGTSGDFLMNGTTGEHAAAHLTDRDLLDQFRQVEGLPAEDRSVIKPLIDAFLTKQKLRSLVG